MDGDANMETISPSLNTPMPEINENRPSVITICNPLTEDASIRQHRPSDIFCDDPDPVQVPSCVKDSKCKPLHINYPIHSLLTATIAELDIFKNGLTEDSIDRAITCFRDALTTRKVLPSDFDPRHAEKTCHRILQLTAKGSISMDNVRSIPKFWVNLEGLSQNSDLNALESCFTRAFCMQGALLLHHWLLDVVPAAVERSSRNSWIDKLAWDVETAINQKISKDFDSEMYLPNLQQSRTFSFTPPKFKYDNREIVTSTVSSIIRVWLQFPADELSLVQLSIIDIVYSKSRPSILFLDKVWDTYSTPFATVFNNWEIRRSKSKIKTELKAFEEEFAAHPFATPDSSEYRKLQHLDTLIHDWLENNRMQGNETDRVSQFADMFKNTS